MARNNAILSSLMFLLLVGSSYAITSSQMTQICDKTLNPSLCLNFLNARFESPNLKALGKTTLDVIQSRSKQQAKRLQSLIDGGVDPRTKLAYRTCLDEYENALGDLEDAFEHLTTGDYMGMNLKVSVALDASVTCLDDVKRLRSVDALVVNNCKSIKNIAGIALVISNMIPSKA